MADEQIPDVTSGPEEAKVAVPTPSTSAPRPRLRWFKKADAAWPDPPHILTLLAPLATLAASAITAIVALLVLVTSQRNVESAQRAYQYLVDQSVTFHDAGEFIDGTLLTSVENLGQTPSQQTRISIDFELPTGVSLEHRRDPSRGFTTVKTGNQIRHVTSKNIATAHKQSFELPFRLKLTDSVRQQIAAQSHATQFQGGDRALFNMTVRAEYFDVFVNQFEIWQMIFVDGHTLEARLMDQHVRPTYRSRRYWPF